MRGAPLRVVFMGSPAFAVPSLDGLLDAGHDVVLILSQPDRPAGRGRQPTPPAVAAFARERGLPLFQPPSLKPPEAFARLREAAPDVIIVAAYGLILRREVLDLPPLGCLNVHASLLPRHRGAAPIPAAILAGDAETGVCLMQMEAGLDTGPVLARKSTPILPEDDTLALTDRLALLGRDVLVETLPQWAASQIAPIPQDDTLASYAPKLQREDAHLDWSLPGRRVVAAGPGVSWLAGCLHHLGRQAAQGAGRTTRGVRSQKSEVRRSVPADSLSRVRERGWGVRGVLDTSSWWLTAAHSGRPWLPAMASSS